jgi:amino acid transporter
VLGITSQPSGPPISTDKVTKALDRKLGFISVFSISVGAMMGSGIFVLPGLAAAKTGPMVGLSYLLAGLLVFPALLSKAELATAMPVAGGTYVYVDRSMGPWMGTITGIGTWFSLCCKTAFALVGLGAYLVLFTSLPPLPVSLAVLAFLLTVNILGASKVSGLQVAIVAVCLSTMIGFGAASISSINPANFEPMFPEGLHGILAGAGFVFVSYSGVTKVCSVAEEVVNPDRNIPMGMLAAQLTVMVLYVLIGTVITGTTPYEQLAHDITPVATAGLAVYGRTGQLVMAVVAFLGLISMCNAGILATSRFPFAMSRDKVFPDLFGEVHPRFGTPLPAILLTGLLLLALVTMLPVEQLAKLASGFKIFIFAIVNLSVIVLRESNAKWYKPSFKSPFYPWTQLVGILGGIWLLIELGALAMAAVAGAVVIGSAWYFGYARKRIQRKSVFQHLWGETRLIKETEALEEEVEHLLTPPVLVPVFGSEPAPERLVRLAGAFSDHNLLEVLLLEEVPEQLHLADYMDDTTEIREFADHSYEIGEEIHVQVAFHDILTHNAKEAVHRHAVTTQAKWIVMERPKREELHFLVRNPFSWWIQHAPCNVAIFKDRGPEYDGDTSDDFKKILVFLCKKARSSELVDIASHLGAQQKECYITLVTTLTTEEDKALAEEVERWHAELMELCNVSCESQIIPTNDAISTVCELGRSHDLLVLDISEEWYFRGLFIDSRNRKIADRASCSVLQIKTKQS